MCHWHTLFLHFSFSYLWNVEEIEEAQPSIINMYIHPHSINTFTLTFISSCTCFQFFFLLYSLQAFIEFMRKLNLHLNILHTCYGLASVNIFHNILCVCICEFRCKRLCILIQPFNRTFIVCGCCVFLENWICMDLMWLYV